MDINRTIDAYQQIREAKGGIIDDFYTGKRKFLILQEPPITRYRQCNSIEEVYQRNIEYFTHAVDFSYTDSLPYLSPWFGVGVYANAFGCEYVWHCDKAPETHYRYHKIEEVSDIEYPDYRKSSIMQMVLDAIDYFKEKTYGNLPISLTDTQSPFDTATLVLDASEFFTACYTEEEIVHQFMEHLTNLIIEFSQVQLEHIGEEIAARPGHMMVTKQGLCGIALSDDNLAISSPTINERIALPYDEKIGEVFGGIGIHSCGNWVHTMELLKNYNNILMIECAASYDVDPLPNDPAKIAKTLQGSGICLKIRVGHDIAKAVDVIKECAAAGISLAIDIKYSETNAEDNYVRLTDLCSELYDR